MRVKLRFFASIKDVVNASEINYKIVEGETCSEIIERLKKDYQLIEKSIERCFLAKNGSYVDRSAMLRDGDELAILPPVSGG